MKALLAVIVIVMMGAIGIQQIQINVLRDHLAESDKRADALQQGTIHVSHYVYQLKEATNASAQEGGAK